MSSFLAPPGSTPQPSRPSRPLTVEAVAHRLGCNPRTARRLIERGRFPNAFRVDAGGPWRVPVTDLEEHVARMKVSAMPVVSATPENLTSAPVRAMAGPAKARRMAT